MLYALMDFIVDQYFPIVDALEDELQALESEIFGEPSVTKGASEGGTSPPSVAE